MRLLSSRRAPWCCELGVSYFCRCPFFALHHASSPWLSSISFCITEQLNAECLNRLAGFGKFKLPMCAKTKRSMSTILALNILSHHLPSAKIAADISVCALFIGFFTGENCLRRISYLILNTTWSTTS